MSLTGLAARPDAGHLHRAAGELAAGLPALLLSARRLAATVSSGLHGRRRPGSGDDFWQFRQSQPGDAAETIDWRQSGKSDHLYVRESEWSVAQTVRLWVDPSLSMMWRSSADLPTKRDRAWLLSVALSILLEQAGERVGLFAAAPSFSGRTAPERLARALIALPADPALPAPGEARRGRSVVISDFLMPLEELRTHLESWRKQGAGGHLLQILDPAEESLPYDGRVLLRDVEGPAEELLPHAQSLREPYRQALAAHRRGLAALAREAGWQFSLHHTNGAPRAALTALHAALSLR